MRKRILALIGPTGTGKTDVIAQWSQDYNLEIISLDSALIYKELSIAANKPDAAFLRTCPHHMINVCSVSDSFNVAEYFHQSQDAIAAVLAKGKVPVLLGGTMMYAYVLSQGLSLQHSVTQTFRQEVLERWPTKEQAFEYLKRNHALSVEDLDCHNTHRVYRALENFLLSEKHDSLNPSQTFVYPYEIDFFGWDFLNKQTHRQILENRVDRMIGEGLLNEISFLYETYPDPAHSFWRFVGYRQYREWREGTMSLDEARYRTIIANCHLAKHQRTWMKKFPLKKMSYYESAGEKEMEVVIKDYAESMKFC